MRNRILALIATLACLSMTAGCQITPASHSATLTVTNSPCTPGAAASTCGYVFLKAVVTGSSCPATTGTSYTPLNQASPVPQPSSGYATYTDPSAAGQTVCYIGQTCQGSLCFSPSAAVGPATVLPNPLAPALAAPSTAENEKPEQIEPSGDTQMAQVALRVKVR
jgi:hypothetical protein